MELIAVVIIILAVVYKLGLFSPIVDLAAVASNESKVYKDEHTAKVKRRYLDADFTFTEEDEATIANNIKAVRDINFD